MMNNKTSTLLVALIGVICSIFAQVKATKKINGWVTMFGCSELGKGMLLRAAISEYLVLR